MDTDDPRAGEGVAAVAAAMAGRLGEISADVQQVIAREIPPPRDDPRVTGLLEASVSENITTMIHSLRYEIDTKGVDAPTSALAYARRLAQREVDAAALVRAYRLGVARFMRLFIEELHRETGGEQIDSSTTMRAIEQINSYSDRVVEQVLEAYERERAGWLQNRSAVQATRVRLILDGERFDIDRAEAALGYRLRQHHVGLILWIDGEIADVEPHRALSELVDDIARLAGGSQKPLFVPRDDSSAWAGYPCRLANGGPVPTWLRSWPSLLRLQPSLSARRQVDPTVFDAHTVKPPAHSLSPSRPGGREPRSRRSRTLRRSR